MNKFQYLTLDYFEIIEKYPKAVKKVKDWFLSREDIHNAFERDNIDQSKREAIVANMVSMIIQHDPRKLYDFFDDQDIRISGKFEADGNFKFWTNDYESGNVSIGINRIIAEERILEIAFEELEKKS